jgi:hypothetical protein
MIRSPDFLRFALRFKIRNPDSLRLVWFFRS